MPVLIFEDRGLVVATAAWSATAKPDQKVELCYQWSDQWLSQSDSASGNMRCTLDIRMDDFIKIVGQGSVVIDFR